MPAATHGAAYRMTHGAAQLGTSFLSQGRKFWWWLRQVTGDAAYENYLRRAARPGSHSQGLHTAVTAEQFYLERVRRKFSHINRCC
jgi:Selenoprotein, putative